MIEDCLSKMKSKASNRIENKKKKMAALLEITKLNEYDRLVKAQTKATGDSCLNNESEPSPKRFKDDQISRNCKITSPPLIGEELGPSGKPKLSGEEYLQLKKMLREKTTKIRQQPNFKLRDMGENASLSTPLDIRTPLFLSDLQHLILYSQLGHHSPYSPARWCNLDKFNRLATTTLFIIENLSLYDFSSNESSFPFISSTFEHKLEILTPKGYKGDLIKDLSLVPLTGTQMRKFTNEYGNLEQAVLKSTEIFDTVRTMFPIEDKLVEEKTKDFVNNNPELPPSDKFSRTLLLLSGWQMIEENFPLPIKGLMERKYSDYVLTKDKYEHVTPSSKMYGIDCEMCKTTTGDLELTRVSIVDENHKLFYDTLVKPDNQITDYLTKFSGITRKMMKSVTKRLQDVQEDLRTLLPNDAILVGQSLANDFHALKMMHPYVIDTSVIFNLSGDRLRKTKLKTLAHEFLNERIQEGRKGHCSTEDSTASLKLTQLKLQKSLYFGDAVMDNVNNQIRSYPELGTFNYATSLLKQILKCDKNTVVVGLNHISSKYKYYFDKDVEVKNPNKKMKFVSEKSCKDVVKKICDSMSSHSLNIGHLKLNDDQLKSGNIWKNIDKWVKDIYEQTPNPGLVIVLFTGTEKANGACLVQLKKSSI